MLSSVVKPVVRGAYGQRFPLLLWVEKAYNACSRCAGGISVTTGCSVRVNGTNDFYDNTAAGDGGKGRAVLAMCLLLRKPLFPFDG